MPIQVDVIVKSAATTASVTTESTKATADIAITGPQGPPGTGLTDSNTHWSSDRDFMPYASGEQSLGSGNYPWGEVFANTGFFNELTVSGALNVSGDFNIGDSLTDRITTQGDLYVKDDAFFADEVVITGNTQAANILPRAHDAYDLGSTTARWGNLHAKSGHFADNTITLGVDGAKISVVSNKIQLQGNSASEGPYFVGDTYVDAGTLSAQKAEGVQFQILNTNSTNSYKFSLDDSGNLGISGYVGSDKTGVVNFSNNVSIATSGYFRLPVGTTAERPPEVFDGMVRLNTTNSQFEGYHSSNWQGLGGVIDVDRDTYVSTEKTSDDDTLYLYTSGVERAKIESNGEIKLNNNTFINNDLTVSGNLGVSGNFTLGDTTADSITSHGDLRVLDDSFFADTVTVTGLAYFKSGVDIEKDLTVSGNVTASDPTQNGHLSTKSYVDSADSNLQTQITSNDADVAALQTATGSLQSQVTSNDTDISTLNTATGNLQTQITNNDTDIVGINTNVTSLLNEAVRTTGDQTITGIKTFNNPAVFLSDVRVSGNIDLGDSEFDKITSKGDLYVDDAAFVNTSLVVSGTATFEGAAAGITPTQDSHLTTKSYVDTVDASFQSQITANDGDIGYLQTATGDLLTRITGNDADITALNTATGNLQTQVTNNDGDITALQTATGSLQTQVSSNDTDISNLNTATGNLQTQVTNNDTDINDLSGIAVMRSGDQSISGVKTFAHDVKILGSLGVSGDFELGDETTDRILAQGDVYVKDQISVTGNANFQGNVGIGPNIPNAPVDLYIANGSTPQMRIEDTTSSVVAYSKADDSAVWFGSASNHPVKIGANNQNHIMIESDGTISVGTSTPVQGIDIRDQVGSALFAIDRGNKLVGIGTTSPVSKFEVKQSTSSEHLANFKRTDNSSTLYVSNSDKVGINTASPNKTLDVAGDISIDGIFYLNDKVRDNRGATFINQSPSNLVSDRTLTLGNTSYSSVDIYGILKAHNGIEITGAPTGINEVTSKGYVDSGDAKAVETTGAQNISGHKTFYNDVTMLGSLAVSGDFTLGDASTNNITTKGDLFVEDDAVFSDSIAVTGVSNFQGSVGVGNIAAFGSLSYPLEIKNTLGNTEVAITAKNTSKSILYLGDTDSPSVGAITYDHSNNYLTFQTNSAERLTLDNNGNLGIGGNFSSVGTDAKLHVAGEIFADKGLTTNAKIEVARFFASRDGVNGGSLSIQARRDSADATARWTALQSMDSGGTVRSLNLNPFGGNVGIGTSAPSVSLDISSTNAIKIPVGTTAQRPTAANGMMRLNTTTNQFEGYNNSVWQGLGGVIDVDQDTYVSTEKTSDDDTLFFYTAGSERARLTSAGLFGIGTAAPSTPLHVAVDGTTEILLERTTNLAGMPSQIRIKSVGSEWALTNNLAGNSKFSIRDVTDSRHVMVFDGDGNVGIGTTSPGAYKLRVEGATFINGSIFVPNSTNYFGALDSSGNFKIIASMDSSNVIQFGHVGQNNAINVSASYIALSARDALGIARETLRVIGPTGVGGAGNVGIGTSTPSVSLDISSTNAIKIPVGTTAQRPTAANGMIRLNTTTNQFEGYNSNWLGLGGVIDIDQDTYVSTEKTSDDDTLFFYTAGSEKARLTSTGRLGIGTATPEGKLHVYDGDASVAPHAGASQLIIEDNGTVGVSILGGSSNAARVYFGSAGSNGARAGRIDYNLSSDLMSFGTANTADQMVIDNNGKVGIGTSAPAKKLHVKGDYIRNESSSAGVYSQMDGDGFTLYRASSNCYLNFPATSSNLVVRGPSYAEFMRVTAGGLVGIGTATPANLLHVYSTGNAEIKAERASGAVILTQAQSALGKFGTTSNHDLQLMANNTGYLKIKTSGNVEIASASTILYGDGDALFSGAAANMNWDRSDSALEFQDNAKIKLGTGDDLQIYHNASDSVIRDAGTGRLLVGASEFLVTNSTLSEAQIQSLEDGAVTLYHNGVAKLATTSTGVDITGKGVFSGGITIATANELAFGDSNTRIVGSSGSDYLRFDPDGSEGMRLTATGLGIGIATPTQKLHSVASAGGRAALFVGSNEWYTTKIQGSTTSGQSYGQMILAGTSSSDFALRIYNAAGSADLFAVRGDGKVGIGTSTPSVQLQTTGDVIVGGNLTVSGTTFTVDTSNVLVEDPVLLLAKNQTGGAALDSGFIVERGTDTNVGFIWDESADQFAVINTTEIADDNDITIASYAAFKATTVTTNTGGGDAVLGSHLDLGDNQKARFGASDDLQIYHNGTHSYIDGTTTGDLYVRSLNDDVVIQAADDVFIYTQAGGNAIIARGNGKVELFYDGSSKLETKSTGVDITGSLGLTGHITKSSGTLNVNASSLALNNAAETKTYLLGTDGGSVQIRHNDSTKLETTSTGIDITGNATFADSGKAIFGAGSDLQIYHDGTDSYIKDAGTGTLRILSDDVRIMNAAGTEISAQFIQDGEARLKYDNVTKLATKTDGVSVTGKLYASGYIYANGGLALEDNDKILLGNQSDLQIYHDGSNSYINEVGTGDLFIKGGNDIIFQDAVGNLLANMNQSNSVELYFGGSKKFETTSTGVTITGTAVATSFTGALTTAAQPAITSVGTLTGLTLTGSIDLQDNDKLLLGAGNDLEIYHDGSNSYIDETGTGNLRIRANDQVKIQKYTGENMFVGIADGAASMYYDNSQKIATTATGVTITGHASMTTGSASGKFAVMYASVHGSYDFYNNGTTYLNGATIIDADTTVNGALDVSEGLIALKIGADTNATTRTNATNKYGRIGSQHYTNAEQPIGVGFVESNATQNNISFGGGSGYLNAATELRFFTAANNTTTTGTEQMRIKSDGNIGIGTTAPAAKLDVVADGGATYAKLGYGTHASFQFYRNLTASSTSLPVMMVRQTHPDDDQTALVVDQDGSGNILELIEDSTTRVVVKADGKVGIGTTTPGSYQQYTETTGAGIGAFSSSHSSYGRIIVNTSAAAADSVLSFQSQSSTKWSLGNNAGDSDKLQIRTGFGVLGDAATRFTLDASGNCGIGTTAPAYELDVAGTISNYGDGKMIRLRSDDYIIAQMEHRGTGVNYDKGYFRLFDTGVTKVVLDSAGNSYINGGNVGIGMTPTTKLSVKSTGSNVDEISLVHSGNTVKLVSLGQESSHGSIYVRNNSGVAQARISAVNSNYFLQNVGIGTTAPNLGSWANTVTLDGSTSCAYELSKGGTLYGWVGIQGSGSGHALDLAAYQGQDIRLRTSTANTTATRVTVKGDGKVGIGTTTPGSYWANADDLVIATTGNTGMTLVAGTTSSSSAIAFADGTGSSAYRGRIEYNHSTDKLMLGAGGTTPFAIKGDGNTSLPDNSKALFGTGDDLQLYHDGSHSYIRDTGTGNLNIRGDGYVFIQSQTSGTSLAHFHADAEVGLYFNNSKKIETTSTGVSITGNATFADNGKSIFGGGNDLEIYHDGSHSYISDVGSGYLRIKASSYLQLMSGDGEVFVNCEANGAVYLSYDNSTKLATTATGVTVTGLLTATTKSFTIDHPTKPGKKLRHGSLEGPENGVYIRGKSNSKVVELPEYWTKLVDKDSITVQLTPIGKHQHIYVESIENNIVKVQSDETRKNNNDNLEYFYFIQAERIDVDKLEVEIDE